MQLAYSQMLQLTISVQPLGKLVRCCVLEKEGFEAVVIVAKRISLAHGRARRKSHGVVATIEHSFHGVPVILHAELKRPADFLGLRFLAMSYAAHLSQRQYGYETPAYSLSPGLDCRSCPCKQTEQSSQKLFRLSLPIVLGSPGKRRALYPKGSLLLLLSGQAHSCQPETSSWMVQ